MRTKILLASAKAGTRGPSVTSGMGVWEIKRHPFVNVLYPAKDGAKVKVLPDRLRLHGKVRVSTHVSPKYVGPPIDLDMVQVEA